MAAKSKYDKHEKEILEMHKNGKSNAEIVQHLNKKYKINAVESSIRTLIKRKQDKQAIDATPKPKVKKAKKTPPAKNETEEVKKVEAKFLVKELRLVIKELGFVAKEFNTAKETHQEGSEVFSIVSNEYGEAAERLDKVTEKLGTQVKKQGSHYLVAGIVLFGMLCGGFVGFYLGNCYYRNAFYYFMILTGIPATALVSKGYYMAKKFRKNELREERG